MAIEGGRVAQISGGVYQTDGVDAITPVPGLESRAFDLGKTVQPQTPANPDKARREQALGMFINIGAGSLRKCLARRLKLCLRIRGAARAQEKRSVMNGTAIATC
jgi:hypothetical protein